MLDSFPEVRTVSDFELLVGDQLYQRYLSRLPSGKRPSMSNRELAVLGKELYDYFAEGLSVYQNSDYRVQLQTDAGNPSITWKGRERQHLGLEKKIEISDAYLTLQQELYDAVMEKYPFLTDKLAHLAHKYTLVGICMNASRELFLSRDILRLKRAIHDKTDDEERRLFRNEMRRKVRLYNNLSKEVISNLTDVAPFMLNGDVTASAKYRPADERSRFHSGDAYGMTKIDDDLSLIFIADAQGDDVAQAFGFKCMLYSELGKILQNGCVLSPSLVVRRLADRLPDYGGSGVFDYAVALYSASRQTLSIVRSGVRCITQEVESTTYVLPPPVNPLLGLPKFLIKEGVYDDLYEETISYKRSAATLFFTDGLSECRRPGELFEHKDDVVADIFYDVLQRPVTAGRSKFLVDSVFKNVEQRAAEFYDSLKKDDLTIICVATDDT